jgi:hypothetical protein
MKKTEMLATIATLTAALEYVVCVDDNGNKITSELRNALNDLAHETKEAFKFDGEDENYEVFDTKQHDLFTRFVDSNVDDLTGQYF